MVANWLILPSDELSTGRDCYQNDYPKCFFKNFIKLDGLGPLDNRPSTSSTTFPFFIEKINYIGHVTRDT